MIFTFYSYNQNAERSMILANMAEWYYQKGWDVLMVDWNLESPGLERFFEVDAREMLTKPGVIDMLWDYKRQISQSVSNIKKGEDFPFLKPSDLKVNIYENASNNGKLYLLTAGRRNNELFDKYINDVLAFDWQDFYQNWKGARYFDWLNQQFHRVADVIFIDSPRGVTNMSGVCTYHLADEVVMLCSPSRQCIHGTKRMAQILKSKKLKKLRGERPLNVLIIPIKPENPEIALQQEFEEEFFNSFNDVFSTEDVSKFWNIGIPYLPNQYTFREKIIPNQDNEGNAKRLKESFHALAKDLPKYLKPTHEYYSFTVITINEEGNINEQQKSRWQFKEDMGNNVELEMVAIPGGTFLMGRTDLESILLRQIFGEERYDNYMNKYANELPPHKVRIPPFYMSKYAISQKQWRAMFDNNPAMFRPQPEGVNIPVEQVSWEDALDFCTRLREKTGRLYRLPSEAEWEYACRAGTETLFHFGNTMTWELANYKGHLKFVSNRPEDDDFALDSKGIYFKLTDAFFNLGEFRVLQRLQPIVNQIFNTRRNFLRIIREHLTDNQYREYRQLILEYAKPQTQEGEYYILTNDFFERLSFENLLTALAGLRKQVFSTEGSFLETIEANLSQTQFRWYNRWILRYAMQRKASNRTVKIDSFKPNAFGLYNMHGNVCEWCADAWHDNYNDAPADEQIWEQGGELEWRVLRGGSWQDALVDLHCAVRNRGERNSKRTTWGFRVVCSNLNMSSQDIEL